MRLFLLRLDPPPRTYSAASTTIIAYFSTTETELDPDDPTLRKEMLIVDTNEKILLTTYSQRRDFDKALASKVTVSNTPKQCHFQ